MQVEWDPQNSYIFDFENTIKIIKLQQLKTKKLIKIIDANLNECDTINFEMRYGNNQDITILHYVFQITEISIKINAIKSGVSIRLKILTQNETNER